MNRGSKLRFLMLLAHLTCCLLTPGSSSAAIEKAEVDALVAPLIDGKWCQGLVVGLVTPESTMVYGYGRTSDAPDAKTPDGDTVFEIGSITKGFTGVLLAEMVGRGEVNLDDPVQALLPDDVKIPQRGQSPITLGNLVAHRSGLPRMPTNFGPKDPTNPYADYTVERMYAFLNNWQPARPPDESYEYSNLGFGLLGHALALRAKSDYETLIAERLLQPLGMKDTSISFSESQRARLAIGHDGDGNAVANWDIPTFAGAGALRSTVDDMVKFVAAGLGLTETALKPAFELSRTPSGKMNDHNDVGLGWMINRHSKAVWHNGQTGGYHSYLAMAPEKKVGVVILSNTGTGVVDMAGEAVFGRLLGQPTEPPKLRQEVKLDETVLDACVGDYPLSPQFVLSITREGNRLYLTATDQPRVRIYPESAEKFFLKIVDAQLTFDPPVDGKCPRLILHQNGLNLPGPRKE